VGFVRAGGGRHEVAINGGGAMKLQAVCRSVEGAGHVVALVRWSRSIGVCGRRNDVCRREEGNDVCAEMGHAEVATSGRKAMVAAVAMMMMAVA
jgi:hypothetical protein